MPIALALATLGVTREQGTARPTLPGARSCPRICSIRGKTALLRASEPSTFSRRATSAKASIATETAAFSPSTREVCRHGHGGVGSADILSPYVEYVLHGPGPEFHSYKPCQFFEDLLEGLPDGVTHNQTVASEDGSMCPIPYADECNIPIRRRPTRSCRTLRRRC